jgi:predicted outer membrane repeat protein
MKTMKLKKETGAILAVTILALTLLGLFAACSNLLSPPVRPADTALAGAAPGEGAVRVSIAGYEAGARTLLPASVTQDDLVRFNLSFDLAGTSIFKTFNGIGPGDLDTAFFLGEGTWYLSISAFLAGNEGVVATATNVPVNVISGKVTTVDSVPLVTRTTGNGTFAWDMTWPEGVTRVDVKITNLNPDPDENYVDSFTLRQTDHLGNITGAGTLSPDGTGNHGSITLPTGSYYIATTVTGPLGTSTRRDALQIFPGMTTRADAAAGYAFTAASFSSIRYVTNTSDYDPYDPNDSAIEGSLRWAVADVPEGGTVQALLPPGTVINLGDFIEITRSLTLEGNGVVLTRSSGQAVGVNASGKDVSLRRIHFKDNQGTTGGAIYCERGNLTVESSLFTGNHAEYLGGAIYVQYQPSNAPTLTLLGNTFYNNTADDQGGAIYVGSGVTAKLGGNIFYGNTANYYNVVFNGGTVTSLGGNVSDYAAGNNPATGSGFDFHGNDAGPVASAPINLVTFQPLVSSEAVEHVDAADIPGYPAYDFYGNPIPATLAQAGAIQTLWIDPDAAFLAAVNAADSVDAVKALLTEDFVNSYYSEGRTWATITAAIGDDGWTAVATEVYNGVPGYATVWSVVIAIDTAIEALKEPLLAPFLNGVNAAADAAAVKALLTEANFVAIELGDYWPDYDAFPAAQQNEVAAAVYHGGLQYQNTGQLYQMLSLALHDATVFPPFLAAVNAAVSADEVKALLAIHLNLIAGPGSWEYFDNIWDDGDWTEAATILWKGGEDYDDVAALKEAFWSLFD